MNYLVHLPANTEKESVTFRFSEARDPTKSHIDERVSDINSTFEYSSYDLEKKEGIVNWKKTERERKRKLKNTDKNIQQHILYNSKTRLAHSTYKPIEED